MYKLQILLFLALLIFTSWVKSEKSQEISPEEEEVDNEPEATFTFKNIPIKYWTEKQKEELQKEVEDNVYISSTGTGSSENFNFYNQLSEDEKIYYDNILAKSKSSPPEFKINTIVNSEKDIDTFINELMESAEKIFTILINENPDLWWIGSYHLNLSKRGTTYTVTFDVLPSNSKFNNYTADDVVKINSEIESMKNMVMSQISRLGLKSNYAILRYIHDFLVTKIVYTLDESRDHIRTLYGALVENKCVCEGYAEAFQYIAKQYGINVIIARSSTHEWNFVEMNGKWYVVDVTWDDPSGDKYEMNKNTNLRTVYFLIGTEHVCYSNQKYSQESSHVLVYSSFGNNQVVYYPDLQTSDYVPTSSELEEIKKIDLSNISSMTLSEAQKKTANLAVPVKTLNGHIIITTTTTKIFTTTTTTTTKKTTTTTTTTTTTRVPTKIKTTTKVPVKTTPAKITTKTTRKTTTTTRRKYGYGYQYGYGYGYGYRPLWDSANEPANEPEDSKNATDTNAVISNTTSTTNNDTNESPNGSFIISCSSIINKLFIITFILSFII